MNIPPPKNLYQTPKRKYEEEIFDYNSKYDLNMPVDNKSILNLPVFSKEEDNSQNLNKNKKKRITSSRWTTTKVYLPGLSTQIPYGLSEEELEAFLIRARIDEINTRLASEIIVEDCEIREHSPEPIYDNRGIRTNTRDQRVKKALQKERDDLYDKATSLFPPFHPPIDFKAEPKKLTKKIYVPIHKFPDYNFVGLIIGPRGITQKKMERESKAKIAIRGKGSIKHGKERMDGKKNAGEEDDLHVFVTADNDKSLKMATEMIEKLLVPIEEGKNDLKREQLRELARIHGTLRDDDSSKGSSIVIEDQSTLFDQIQTHGQPKVMSSVQSDQVYEEFRSKIQDNLNPIETTDETNPYQMLPQFMPSQDENLQTGELPPIIPTIFNLFPTLPVPPGLPDKHPWDEDYTGL